jgi:hypothetical protein
VKKAPPPPTPPYHRVLPFDLAPRHPPSAKLCIPPGTSTLPVPPGLSSNEQTHYFGHEVLRPYSLC